MRKKKIENGIIIILGSAGVQRDSGSIFFSFI